jgi:thioredoxin-related protein
MMKRLLFLLLMLPAFVMAQGIKFENGLTWEQVKAKAKEEKKYIFLDCHTTWCSFCKKMDAQVFVDPKVGDYFNDKFISVKVQFDQTKQDGPEVKSWYEDAKVLAKQYMIDGYPTFLFFSPQGTPVHRGSGFQTSAQFLELGMLATKPGAKYEDKLTKYNKLMDAHKAGERNYDEYPFMIGIAEKVQEKETADKLRKELLDYVISLPREKRYTKDRIVLWNAGLYASTARTYGLFLKDGDLIDKVMGQKGYAARFLDKTIQAETVTPFFEEQAKGTGVAVSGMYMGGSGLKANTAEADWKALEKMLTDKYGKETADHNMYTARIEWYNRHSNKDAMIKYSLLKYKKYPVDMKTEGWLINGPCWDAFINSTDMKILKECAQWMEKVAAAYPKTDNMIDTYAQLLYKTNQKQKAIEWESKAASLSPEDKTYAKVVDLMKQNRPTYMWGDMSGATNWEGINHINWEGFFFNKFVIVKTEDNKPLAGVSVLNKRSKETKTTSEKGYVGIDVSAGDVLVISSPGYPTQEVKVSKKADQFNLVFKPGN